VTPEQWIKEIINRRGLIQRRVAEWAQIPEARLSNILCGRGRFDVAEFLSVCIALDIDPGCYLEEKEGQ